MFDLIRTLPNLFDTYTQLTDGQIDLLACSEVPVNTDYVFFLSKSYNRNVELLRANFSQALTAIERLLETNSIREARYFVNEAVLSHIEVAVDFDPFLRMLLRVCPLIPIDHRNEACKEVMNLITYQFKRVKFSKKLAPLCFELVLAILDLCVIEAPKCAQYLLEKNEFYPWKDLAPRFTEFVRLCANYDRIETTKSFSDLDTLSDILRLVSERAKSTLTIYQATHQEALQAILRWSGLIGDQPKKRWPRHVYRMGEAMLNLLDKRQIKSETLVQLIEALRKKVADNEENDDQEELDHNTLSFFNVSLPLCSLNIS